MHQTLPHLFDSAAALPEHLVRVRFRPLTQNPLDVVRLRPRRMKLWRSWAEELEPDERRLEHSTLDPSVAADLKRLLLDRVA